MWGQPPSAVQSSEARPGFNSRMARMAREIGAFGPTGAAVPTCALPMPE
jgi:hypothetical protein